jgi:predicted DNA-binding transcriptional regulator AlpA
MSPPPADRSHVYDLPERQSAAEATFGAAGPLLTEIETAQLLGISPRTLQNWRRSGRGPVHVRLGGLVRYAPQDVDAFIARGRSTAASKSDAKSDRVDPLQAETAALQTKDKAADKPENDQGLSLIVRAMMRAQKTGDI